MTAALESKMQLGRSLRAVLYVGVPLAILGVLVLRADWERVPTGWPLLAAVLFSTAGAVLRPLLWVALLPAVSGDAGHAGNLAHAIRGANRTGVARYLPGRIAFWAARFTVGTSAAYPRSAVAASLVLDNVLSLGVMATLGGGALLWACCSPLLGAALLASGLALLVVVLVTAGGATHRSLGALSRRLPAPLRLRFEVLPRDGTLAVPTALATGIVATYLLWALVRGAAFVAIALSSSNLGSDDVVYLIAVTSIAAFGGQLAFFAPMGLGAREGIAAALLASLVPVAVASTIVTSSRIVQVATEIPGMIAIELAVWLWRSAATRKTPLVGTTESPAKDLSRKPG